MAPWDSLLRSRLTRGGAVIAALHIACVGPVPVGALVVAGTPVLNRPASFANEAHGNGGRCSHASCLGIGRATLQETNKHCQQSTGRVRPGQQAMHLSGGGGTEPQKGLDKQNTLKERLELFVLIALWSVFHAYKDFKKYRLRFHLLEQISFFPLTLVPVTFLFQVCNVSGVYKHNQIDRCPLVRAYLVSAGPFHHMRCRSGLRFR